MGFWFMFQGGPGIRGARGDRGEPGVTVGDPAKAAPIVNFSPAAHLHHIILHIEPP